MTNESVGPQRNIRSEPATDRKLRKKVRRLKRLDVMKQAVNGMADGKCGARCVSASYLRQSKLVPFEIAVEPSNED